MSAHRTRSDERQRSAIILAGGEGVRLRSLTRKVAGDDRPKQFCTILDRETLLEQTRRRVSLLISPQRTLVLVTRTHERFYAPLVRDLPSSGIVVQPENRGTAPAILYGLLRLANEVPHALVALFPSDHYITHEERFMAHVDGAFKAVNSDPKLVVLLGIKPEYPEVGYGWIEVGEQVSLDRSRAVFRVRRFWEKPSAEVALSLWCQGCLWNSFMLVAAVETLLEIVGATLPELYTSFAPIRASLRTPLEAEAVREIYSRLPHTNFSESVLTANPPGLAVMPVSDVEWSDVGEPCRVLAVLARRGIRPEWAGAGSEIPVRGFTEARFTQPRHQ